MKAKRHRLVRQRHDGRGGEAAEAAGADVIVAQGMEAGGHRGAFDAATPSARWSASFALIPAVADAVKVPVVAAGGIADARGVAAALLLGASAVQIGTGFRRSPEAKLPKAWADALGAAAPEDTLVTRAFSGRAGRSLATLYARAASARAQVQSCGVTELRSCKNGRMAPQPLELHETRAKMAPRPWSLGGSGRNEAYSLAPELLIAL